MEPKREIKPGDHVTITLAEDIEHWELWMAPQKYARWKECGLELSLLAYQVLGDMRACLEVRPVEGVPDDRAELWRPRPDGSRELARVIDLVG